MAQHETSFNTSCQIAEKYEDMWQEYYKKRFPNYKELIKTKPEKSVLQAGGVDRIVIQEDEVPFTADEKTLQNVYEEIAFEYISNSTKGTPGWANKPLMCDEILYAFGPIGQVFEFDRVTIQKVWKKYGEKWLKNAKDPATKYSFIVTKETIVAPGMSYLSYNCAVPIYIVEQVYREELIKQCITPLSRFTYSEEEYLEKKKEYNEKKSKTLQEKTKEALERIKKGE